MRVGQQRQHGAFLAEHAADQGVDRDQQAELGQVGPQPQPTERGAGRLAPAGHRPGLAAPRRSRRPSRRVRRPVRRRRSWPARSSRLAARHRPARRARTSPRRPVGQPACAGGERAELDVRRAGHVPGGVLAVLPDVEHGGRPPGLRRSSERGGRDGLPGGAPGGACRRRARRRGCRSRSSAPARRPRRGPGRRRGRRPADGRRVTSQPSQVANAARSGMDSAPGMCPAAKSATGRTSTTSAARGQQRAPGGGAESGQARGAGPAAPGPRRLSSPQPQEVRRVGAQASQQRLRRTRPRPGGQQRVGRPSPRRWWWCARRRAGPSRTTPPRASATPRVVVRQRARPLQRPVLGPGQLLGLVRRRAGRCGPPRRPAASRR